ncbi:MAG: GNAT family N-acetyltransferase [Rubrivivax sp.]|nr:GNAT family N-acetyltransferase [Rubrivivax sp.]
MVLRALRRLLGDAAVWRVYRWDAANAVSAPTTAASRRVACRSIDAAEVASLPDALLAEQAWYTGQGAHAFAGCLDDGRVVGLCFHWHGERYNLGRFWPLGVGAAMLMQIVTTPAARGRGVARALIMHSAQALADAGMRTLWARVWLTNAASSAAFIGAGWREVAWVIEINPMRRPEPWRLRLRRPFA